ncbi:hypothetical protein, conserved [Babesia ovata]|uniref:Extracellular matrix-binding ebh n=1 Tax=Babesia ovata TaxID=189622 RepID=A0A2H6KKI4_9APIC|nr:uncharacterized protein BOVATA_049850 [Babesia ovata]GBE63492.1 hypothetical protein, conserved [Babesia ovata]
MCFLHGVLDNIKPKLGLHKETLNNAIDSLDTHKHSGKDGFNEAIVKVVLGVRQYNEGVVKSNTSIKSPIWTFLQPFKKDKGELMKQINALQVSDVPRQAEQEASKAKSLVESCLRHSNVFDSALSKLTKDINDLNAQCKTSVNSSHKNVKYEIKRLEQLSSREHGDLAAMIKLIGTKLNGLGVEVKDEICKQVRDLVEHLKGRVQLIKLQLEDVNKSLKEYLKDIDQWMSEADRIVDENTSQTGFIIDKKPGWEYRQKLEKLPDEMKNGVRDQLQSKVQEARQNLEKLDKVYKNKLWSIAEAVKQVEPAIEKLGGVIENGDADVGKGKNIKSIVNHVKGKVEGIQGIKGLQGIKNGVVTYAMGVARNMEDATIVTWVSEIAKNNETVNRDIGYYFKKSGDLQKAIKAITNKIKGIVSKVGKKPSDQGDVKSILASIHKYHQAVAEAVREKLAWKEVCNIAKEVEDEPELKSTSKSPTFKMGFEYAVQTILRHVYTSASNLATEFESFVSTKNTNLDTNIDTALSEAEPLFKHLNQAVAGTNHAQAVDTAIAQVQTQVQHISGPADNVNLGDSSINSERDAAYNPLEQAIQGISSEASLLTVKATSDALGDWGEKITKHLTQLLQEFSKAGEQVKWNLGILKDEQIGKKLKNIRQQLEKLQQGPVTKALNEANDILKKAEEVTANTLRPLKNKVDQQVSSAISELSTLARKQYISSIKSLLTEFSKKVEEELEGVPEEIEKDLEQGHKKFMQIMYEPFVTRVKRIEDVDPNKFTKAEPPLHQAARRLSGAISALFSNCQKVADLKSDFGIMKPTQKALDRVLTGLWASNHFDNKFSNNLDALNDTLATFNPKTYGEGKYPYILEAFRKGFAALFTKLEHAYVNAYSGMKFTRLLAPKKVDESENVPDPQRHASNVVSTSGQLSDPSRTRRSAPAASSPVPSTQPTAPPVSGQKAETEYELTPEGRDCAKVCVTIMERVKNHLFVLERECNSGGRWRHNSIRLYDHTNGRKTDNPLGTWLRDHGFRVPSEEGKQDGELRNNLGFTGHKMKTTLLDHNIPGASQVRSLLNWVTEERKNASPGSKKSATGIDVFDIAHCLRDLFRKYYEVCHHEHVDSPRAPSNIYDMLQWLGGLRWNPMYSKLKEHLRTLFPKPLKDDSRDYKEIPAKDLQLEAYPKTITYDDLSDELLQSVCIYAQDALIGILGHGHADGVYACNFFTNTHKLSYPSSVGSCFDMLIDIVFKVQHQLHFVYKQCCDATALSGWSDCVYGNGVGGSGWQCNRLQCPNQNTDQTHNQTHKQTCTQKCDQTVSCGLKSPLQSFLEDGLQGFLPHPMTKVGCGVKCSVGSHRGQPCKTPMGFSDISVTASHVKKGAHLAGVLDSFCGPTSHLMNTPVGSCGPYLESISNDIRRTFSEKRAGNYLSWVVYITETFYDLLKKLYDDCCSNCNKAGTRCYDRSCAGKCAIKLAYDAEKAGEQAKQSSPSQSTSHQSKCHSIVTCRNMHPTLYKYGFTFGSPHKLSGEDKTVEHHKRTCKDFCITLGIVIKEGNVLYNLVHKGKALDDIDAHRISLGQLAGQLSDFIGGGEEVKKAILNGLHSNVTQLEKLVKTSCGDKGCCKDAVNFRVGPLKNLQEQFNDIDKIEREIDGLKNEIAEKRKASEGTPPGSDTEIQKLTREIEEKKLKLDEQKRLVDQQINNLNGALNEFNKKFSRQVSTLTASVRQCEEEIERYKESEKASKKDLKDADISIPYNLSHPLETEQAKLQSHNASLESLESLEKLITFHEEVSKNPKTEECKNILTNLCSGLEKFLGYQETSKGYSGDGIVYSGLDRLCDGVMCFLHGVLDNIKPKLGLHKETLNNAIDSLDTHKHSGKDGFNEAIVKVVLGVRQYNEGVREGNKKVADEISSLMTQLGRLKDDTKRFDNHRYIHQIDTKVSDCLDKVYRFNLALDVTNQKNVEDLSPQLQHNVKNSRKYVYYHRDRLEAIWKKLKTDRDEVIALVDKQLGDVKSSINTTTAHKIREFVQKLNAQIYKLRNEIEDVDKKLKNHVDELDNWINKAHEAVEAGLVKVTEIMNHVSGPKAQNKEELLKAVDDIKNKGLTLFKAYETAEKSLAPLFADIGTAVEGLDGKIIEGLETLKSEIKKKLETYITQLATYKWSDAVEGSSFYNLSEISNFDKFKGIFKEWLCQAAEHGIPDIGSVRSTHNSSIGLKIVLHGLDYLKQRVEKAGTNGFGALSEDLQGEIDAVMSQYVKSSQALKSKMTGYATHVGASGPGTLVSALDKGRSKILEPFNHLKSTADSNSIKQVVSTFNSHFQQLCTAILTAVAIGDQSARGKLEELKTFISKINNEAPGSLHNLHKQLGELRTDKLEPLMKEAENIITNATLQSDVHISTLKQHVNEQVDNARSKIVNEIRKRYVLFFKEQLTTFSKKVDEELHDLPTKITNDSNHGFKGLMQLLQRVLNSRLERANTSGNLGAFSPSANAFFLDVLAALNTDRKIMPATYLSDLQNKLNTLLSSLSKYDRPFQKNLSALASTLSTIRPASYSAPTNPLLDVLKTGLTGMHDELQKAYVSVYDGEAWQPEHENKYAKICFTCLPTLTTALTELREQCETDGDWKTEKLCLMNSTASNPLGNFLDQCGYTVAQNNASKDGELQHKSEWNGQKILADCLQAIPKAADIDHLKTCMPRQKQFTVLELLRCILSP